MPTLPQGWELILILIVGILLFGSKKLPGAARSLGQSLRIFKAETKGLREDDDKDATATVHDTAYTPTPVAPPAPIVPPTTVVPPVGEQPRQP